LSRRATIGTRGAALAGAVIAAWVTAASCRTVPPRGAQPLAPAAPALLPDASVPLPVIRVGILSEVPRVSIGAESGVVIWTAAHEGGGGRKSRLPRATFMAASGAAAPPHRFRVQVVSLASESGARAIARRVEETLGLPPTVEWNATTLTHQVRVGDFASRDLAQGLAGRLGRSGLPGAWVVEEAGPGGGRIRLLETGEEYGVVTVAPSVATEILSADAAPYRGLLEVRPGGGGTLTIVNIVNLEDYVRGVVPNELSPQAFPQIEALKAQAVAARSYALGHRVEYKLKGFDLCASAACQVYRGRSSETPLSDQAVEETRGIVALYGGKPINAFYTSTCGGHTEDGENVFEGETAPYLRGVACAPERSAWATLRTSASPRTFGDVPGLSRDISLLIALGVLEPRLYTVPALKGIPTDAELKAWTGRLLIALRRKGCESPVGASLARRGTFAQFLVGSLCWEERAERLLNPQDADYLLQVEDRRDLSGDGERLATAVLVQEGVLSPFPDNTLRPNVALTRAQAVTLLARAGEKAGLPGLLTAEFAGAPEGQITVMRAENAESYPLDGAARLYRNLDGVRAAASELSLAVGDRVSFVLQEGRVTYLEADQTRKGVASDRSSGYYRWEVRTTPLELGQALARYGNVGRVRDLVPRRLGVSGRVVELEVRGEHGDLFLKGLRVRWGLGLRENLFVIDRETDAKGAVERFVFTGKGWGHGVGLCQVGAFGMAQAGATYEQILRHYYSGIGLGKVG
jgi:stage II sporulation protein D